MTLPGLLWLVHRLGKHPALAAVRPPHVQDEGDGAREVHDLWLPTRPIASFGLLQLFLKVNTVIAERPATSSIQWIHPFSPWSSHYTVWTTKSYFYRSCDHALAL